MIDEHGREIFQADIPYKVSNNNISNEDQFYLPLHKIWVDFRLVHQQ